MKSTTIARKKAQGVPFAVLCMIVIMTCMALFPSGVTGATSSVTIRANIIQTYGSINVTSVPPGAWIFLDNADTSHNTNFILTDVPVGTHTVYVILADYVTPTPISIPVVAGQEAPGYL